MLQYLVILLDDTSVSYCHYEVTKTKRRPISPDTLHRGIRFAMMENLMIQFVYPDYELPEEIRTEIETIDHTSIRGTKGMREVSGETDVMVKDGWAQENGETSLPTTESVPIAIRTSKKELFAHYKEIKGILRNTPRLNVVITDIETFTDEDFESYGQILKELAADVESLYAEGKAPQLNLLTDRMMLTAMNNCGAGDTTITLAPNGKFYVCPAFYYEDEADSIGDLGRMKNSSANVLDIKNKQLYKLKYAPICRHCDAWQCKRCIWLNRKTTFEVNTPSHEQCVTAHIERSASRDLLAAIRKQGTFLPEQEISETDYIDPFDKRKEW